MSDTSASYLRAILDHSADAIVTCDSQARVVEWNPAAERLFGWRKKEIVGRPVDEVWVEPSERQRILRLIEKKGRVIDYETKLRAKDGRVIEVSLTLSELKDEKDRLIGTIGISKDIRKRKKLERELKRLAITDSLTTLFNRAHFNSQLVEEVERARRQGHPLALALADLDGFKEYNDSEGHQAGDSALRRIGRGLLSIVRRHVDSAYRYGGDEFTFLFPELDPAAAREAAERARAKIEEIAGPRITGSIGVAMMSEGESPKELLRRADGLMYRAKKHGGNRVEST